MRWVFVLAAAVGGFQPQCEAQDAPTCGTASFPFEALTKPGDCDAGAADFAKAVSQDRMIELSNCGGKIYCKEGSAMTSNIVPLSGTNLDTCIFQLSSDIGGDLQTLFDSRVIWDPYLDRFWIVTAERGEVVLGNGNRKWRGKLHIAVSTDGSPDAFGTYHWTKYTTGGTREALNVNSLPNSLPSLADAFPDRPSIMVDDTYLFIAMKEADPGHQFNNPPEPNHFFDARSLMLTLKKSEIIAGNTHANIVETSQFIDSAGAGGTWGHELAVEQDAYTYPNGEHKVYTVALPGLYDITPGAFDGHQFTSIDFGAFRWNGSAWVFSHAPISLNNAQKFRAVFGGVAPGDNQTNGDKNQINPLFWQAAVRSVGGTRKICAINDGRPDSDSDTDGIIQYYIITPNNYPGGTPGKSIGRYNPAYGWVHDSSIAMNGCGDIAISYTRSGRDNGNNAIYPQFWRWLIPSGGASTKSLVQAGPSQYLDGQGWADFNQMAADPSDPTQFFALHILVHNDTTCGCSHHSTWAGWVAKVTIAGCGQKPGGGDGPRGFWAFLDFLNAARNGEEEADLDGDGEVTAMDYLLAREMLEGAGP